MSLGPSQSYLAQYNSFVLPGYVQSESFPSESRIVEHYAAYADGSNSEYTGLNNKVISLKLKVWEQDYATCKQQVQKAATMLRSKRDGFAPLYIQFSDRYYEAMTGPIRVEATAGSTVRTLEYTVDFQCKPWLVSTASYTASGTGLNGSTQTFSTAGRTIDDGGWTYGSVLLSGTNVTVSGYTATGDFAGFISVSGAITNLTIDSENYTSTTSNGTVNRNSYMKAIDYRMWVGPQVTYFTVTGATKCEITYKNRWYL